MRLTKNYNEKLKTAFIFVLEVAFFSYIMPQNLNVDSNIGSDLYKNSFVKASSVLDSKQYPAWKVIDGKEDTAWSEGKIDEGIGEWLEFYVEDPRDPIKYIEILSGFAKNERLFYENNRPKDIKITMYTNPEEILETHSVLLNDVRKFQKISLGKRIIEKKDNLYKYGCFTRIEIMSVYKGTKYNDTCISEIRMYKESGEEVFAILREKLLNKPNL